MKAGKRIGSGVGGFSDSDVRTLYLDFCIVCHAGICNDGEEYEIAAG